MEETKSRRGIIWVIVILVIAAVAYLVFRYTKQNDNLVSTPTLTSTPTTPIPTPAPVPTTLTTRYRDGTYSTVGEYVSPGGEESISVKLTLAGDVITSAEVISNATRPNSVKYQGQFISGYKTLVVGKNIDDVVLDKVSGSSLTPKGFNDALSKIKIEARV